jgi:futalosine hydrolase
LVLPSHNHRLVSKRIAVVAATTEELAPFLLFLQKEATQHSFQSYQLHQLQIDILYSGIGVMQTTYHLMDYLSHRHPDGWIQAGIGGAYDRQLSLGTTYQVTSEIMIGFGAQQQDGTIHDPFRMEWMDPDAFPYESGVLHCPYHPAWEIEAVSGMTSFYAHGQASSIELLSKSATGQVENMEGTPFFYISLVRKIPFLSIRSISNYVEPRNRAAWKMRESIDHLNQTLIDWLHENDFNFDRMFGIGNKHA